MKKLGAFLFIASLLAAAPLGCTNETEVEPEAIPAAPYEDDADLEPGDVDDEMDVDADPLDTEPLDTEPLEDEPLDTEPLDEATPVPETTPEAPAVEEVPPAATETP